MHYTIITLLSLIIPLTLHANTTSTIECHDGYKYLIVTYDGIKHKGGVAVTQMYKKHVEHKGIQHPQPIKCRTYTMGHTHTNGESH